MTAIFVTSKILLSRRKMVLNLTGIIHIIRVKLEYSNDLSNIPRIAVKISRDFFI